MEWIIQEVEIVQGVSYSKIKFNAARQSQEYPRIFFGTKIKYLF